MDRLGYRLEGPPLAHRARAETLSDGLLPGAIQVPSGDQPIVLMPDGPTTGGYPKIPVIIGPDLGRPAQTRRTEKIRFRSVVWEQAHEAARLEEGLSGLTQLGITFGQPSDVIKTGEVRMPADLVQEFRRR